MKRFVRVKVDATNDDEPQVEAIKTRYRVIGSPTIVLVGSVGEEQARFTRIVGPDQLVPIPEALEERVRPERGEHGTSMP